MMMRKTSLIFLMLSFAIAASGQDKIAPITEVTRTDFTKLERIRSTELSTYGVQLGDAPRNVLAQIRRLGLIARQREIGNGIDVWDGDDELFSVVITDDHVSKIAWYKSMQSRLAGESRHLLDPEIVDRESTLRLRLLGREDSVGSDSGYYRNIKYSYDREGILVVSGGGSPVIQLFQPAKVRER